MDFDNSTYKLEFRSLRNSRRVNKYNSVEKVQGFYDKEFLIEPYQRGYRWRSIDVKKLLDDLFKYAMKKRTTGLKDFIEPNEQDYDHFSLNDFDFYCLQTVTVRPLEDSNKQIYELIDGQQRLTTLHIIYSVLCLLLDGRFLSSYKLTYARGNKRENASDLINNLILKKYKDQLIQDQYILYDDNKDPQILEWLKEYKQEVINQLNTLSYEGSLKIDTHYFVEAINTVVDFCFVQRSDNLRLLRDIIKYNVYLIWYETLDDAYKTFVSLNTNQIKLTNSELVKALILKYDSIEKGRWENLEQGLCRTELWAFICGEEKATKLDLLLELYARFDKVNPYIPNESDEWALFSWYEKLIDSEDKASNVLKNVEFIYDCLCEWYDDVDVYHYIGLLTKYKMLGLISGGNSKPYSQEQLVFDIYNDYHNSNNRADFLERLKKRIREALKTNIKDASENAREFIEQLSYDSQDSTQKQRNNIQGLLWLLNAWETVISSENNTSNKRTITVNNRLPFSKVIEKKWTLEHIMPQNPEEENRKDEKYDLLVKGIINDNAEKYILGKDEVHSVYNLALLASDDNSANSNENLNEKKEIIVKRIGDGSFVPCSTINVFLLYYNKTVKTGNNSSGIDWKYWTKFDAGNYRERIIECLEQIGFGG